MARPGASQLVVLRDGETLVDDHVNCSPDSLFMTWSSYKPMASVLVFQLAHRGELDLDAPISWLWPEFAAGGKGRVSTRDVLRHRSGLDARPVELLGLTDPRRAARIVAGLRARPARGARYQVLAYGVILGEINRRITGQQLGEAISGRILDPLGLEGHLGLPPSVDERAIRHTGGGAISAVARSGAIRRSPIASGGFWTTARSLAVFYDALGCTLAGDEPLPDFSRADVEEMTRESFHGRDGTTGLRTRWATGVQLATRNSFFGTNPNPRTFGHNGSNIAIGWHDPDTRTTMALMNQHIWPPGKAVAHFRTVADEVARL